MLVYALALLLAQADPAAAGQAGVSAAAADTPKGAPAENYDFVAWCHGALGGHMALYQEVKPELVSIEQPGEVALDEKNDKDQLAAGREYLALYARALNAVDKGHPAMLPRRRAAESQGAAIWEPFKSAAPRQRMWAWVGWDLPGRCETAAHKLLTPAGRIAALKSPAPTAAPDQPASIDDALSAPGAAPPSPAADSPALRGPQ